MGDKTRVELFLLDPLFKDLLGDLVVFHLRGNLHAHFVAFFAALFRRVVPPLRVHPAKEVTIRRALPRAAQVDGAGHLALLVFVFDHEGAAELHREVTDHFLHHVGHHFKIPESLVGFQHGEFRIVPPADAFVAEIPVQFKYLGEPADQQPFQIKLRRDPQVERLPESIVEGLKRPGRRPTGHCLQHRGFHFQIIPLAQPAADFRHDFAPGQENLAAPLIRHQVQIPLAVFDLAVGHPVPFVGHRAQRFGEHRQPFHLDGRLLGFGQKRPAPHSDPVAEVDAFLEHREGFLRHILRIEETLEAPADVSHIKENRLPHVPQRGHPARHAHVHSFGKNLLQDPRRVGGVELPAKRLVPQFPQARQFLAADREEFTLIGRRHRGRIDRGIHGAADLPQHGRIARGGGEGKVRGGIHQACAPGAEPIPTVR